MRPVVVNVRDNFDVNMPEKTGCALHAGTGPERSFFPTCPPVAVTDAPSSHGSSHQQDKKKNRSRVPDRAGPSGRFPGRRPVRIPPESQEQYQSHNSQEPVVTVQEGPPDDHEEPDHCRDTIMYSIPQSS